MSEAKGGILPERVACGQVDAGGGGKYGCWPFCSMLKPGGTSDRADEILAEVEYQLAVLHVEAAKRGHPAQRIEDRKSEIRGLCCDMLTDVCGDQVLPEVTQEYPILAPGDIVDFYCPITMPGDPRQYTGGAVRAITRAWPDGRTQYASLYLIDPLSEEVCCDVDGKPVVMELLAWQMRVIGHADLV